MASDSKKQKTSEWSDGMQDAEWHLTNEVKDIYPDFVKMADSFSVPAKRVLRPEDLRPAIRYVDLHPCYLTDLLFLFTLV